MESFALDLLLHGPSFSSRMLFARRGDFHATTSFYFFLLPACLLSASLSFSETVVIDGAGAVIIPRRNQKSISSPFP